MAVVTKTNPVGLDAHIQKQQQSLYSYLKTKWGLTDDTYQSYGLCYRNYTPAGYVAEVYTDGNDYQAVDKDFDSYKLVSFYGVGDNIKTTARMQKADVFLIMFADLSQLTGIKDLQHRGANEAKLEVYRYLCKQTFGFEILGQVTGLDSVLKEYPGLLKGNMRQKGDSHPWHAFRFNMQCTYNPTAEL